MDMLVPLYRLPPVTVCVNTLRATHGITIRLIHTFERSVLRRFIEANFGCAWADEVEMGFRHMPPSILIAIREEQIVGFAAYDCTFNGFFGPTGVLASERGKGVGTALLLASLDGLRTLGYVYGVIGSAGPVDFYARTVQAIPIPDSSPGAYQHRIKQD